MEKVLVDLLAPEGEDVCVKTATCKAVHAMSFHESSRDTLGELGTLTSDCDAALFSWKALFCDSALMRLAFHIFRCHP